MRARLVRCAPGADAGPGADGARCAASADAAGAAAGGAAAACTGAALGGAVRAGRGWRATGSGRLEKLRIKEAMTRGALPHGGGGRCFAFGGRAFRVPLCGCVRSRSRHGCGSAPVPLRASVSSVQRTQETRLVARSGAYRRAALSAPAVRRFGGLAGPPSCIPNPRFLLQIFDLEKESRASAGQAARFQRAACLADMRGGFGSLAPARLPYAGRRLRRKGACAQWALGPKAQSDLQA